MEFCLSYNRAVPSPRHSFVYFLPYAQNLFLQLIYCVAISLTSLSVSAQSRWSISAGSSLASTQFDWSIAGNMNGQNPNILSELRYTNIKQWGLGVDASYALSNKLNLQIRALALRTFSGQGTDMDYQGDNRTGNSYLLNFESKNGGRQLVDLTLMYETKSLNRWNLFLGVVTGLSTQTLALTSAETSTLNSPYRTTIMGIGPALTVQWAPATGWLLDMAGTGRIVSYQALATWNLIPAFEQPRSFTHRAAGSSWTASIKIQKQVSPQGHLFLRAESLWDIIQRGVDRAYLRDGSRPETRFNNARGSSLLAHLGYTLHF